MNNTLTALKGIKVGHSTHKNKLTGCTFILFDKMLPVAYKSYGGAPGTFNTEPLRNGMSYYHRNGLFIAGGSLNGLASANFIMQRMIENKITSYPTGAFLNPSISGAIVFDLGMNTAQYNPAYGIEAFDSLNNKPVERGNVGAGTGVTVGKFSYTKDMLLLAMKTGLGCARVDLNNGIIVTALSVVNALGNVIKKDGSILAGNRHDTLDYPFRTFEETSNFLTGAKMNTTISIVGLNVDLEQRENYEKIAQFAAQGQVRAISPVNTSVDGDTVFVFSTEEIKTFLSPIGKSIEKMGWHNLGIDLIGNAAANAVQNSIHDACIQAETIKYGGAYNGIIPSIHNYPKI